jgi:DNA-binding NarL/FixJ family response regulator
VLSFPLVFALPDVVIVDIRLPPTHTDEGLRAALQIRADHPGMGVLVLSQYVEVGLAMKLLADSADGVGYLLKDRISDVPDFLGAVRRVATGVPPSTRRSYPRCSPGGARRTRSPSSPRANARSSG